MHIYVGPLTVPQAYAVALVALVLVALVVVMERRERTRHRPQAASDPRPRGETGGR